MSCLASLRFAVVFDSFLTNALTLYAKESVRSSKSNNFEFPVSVIRVCFEFRASSLLRYDMAFLTRPPCEWRMVIGLEELRVFRSMGIMAVSAIHDSRFNTDVSFAKGRLLKIVAFST